MILSKFAQPQAIEAAALKPKPPEHLQSGGAQ
jgi:hypothetical protein